jgi:hypothetical protein
VTERYQYKQGDTVRVKPTPSEVSRLNGREWPAGFVGYIEGYTWSDHDDTDCPMYWLYGNQFTPAWGITFAESDLELVETVGQRRAEVPTTQQELTRLRTEVAYLRSALAGFMDVANEYEAAHRDKIETDEYYKGLLDGQVKMAALAANILRKVATDEAGTESE